MIKETKKGINTLSVVEIKTTSPKQNPNMLPLKKPNKGNTIIKIAIINHIQTLIRK